MKDGNIADKRDIRASAKHPSDDRIRKLLKKKSEKKQIKRMIANPPTLRKTP